MYVFVHVALTCIAWFERDISVAKNFAKMTKSAKSEALFSETRPERILEPFWKDFWTILGGFGVPKSEKCVSESTSKKRLLKSHARAAGRHGPGEGGALYKYLRDGQTRT